LLEEDLFKKSTGEVKMPSEEQVEGWTAGKNKEKELRKCKT